MGDVLPLHPEQDPVLEGCPGCGHDTLTLDDHEVVLCEQCGWRP